VSNVAPVLASVVVLSIQDYARKAVMEQVRLKDRIEALVRSALAPVAPARRIVLDAPQGIAVALLDRPRAALEFAERVQAAAADLPLRIGINHGPVTITEDANRGHALVGDGIAAGMTMAQAAAPGRLVASRAFRDALDADAPDSAARLGAAGVHTDAQVRTHELYTPDRRAANSRHRRLAFAGVAAFAGILALGGLARFALIGSGLRDDGAPAPVPPPAPAVIKFEIAPLGEIYIDDILKGTSPPLTQIEIVPGPHTIEVRHGKLPPLRMEINPEPAEELTVTHTFASPRAAARTKTKTKTKAPEKGLGDTVRDGWRSFRRSAGF
jgi:hypothetical protein